MKDTDFSKIIELTPAGGGWLPANQNARELLDTAVPGEVLSFEEVTARDLKFHRAYFSLMGYIWDWMPKHFKSKIPKDKFYLFCKHVKGDYEVVYQFKDGTTFVEYKSIAFGRMSQQTFKAYVREQLPVIYADIIEQLYEKPQSDQVIACIEDKYQKFLSKL